VTVTDPVTQHLAELERALRGPARTRRSMLREVRDGLHDAVTAYRACGLDPHRAAAKAVHDFGPVPEVAPLFQDELTARQGRWSALLLVVVFPGMVLGWDLLWKNGVAWGPTPPPDLVVVLAHVQDAASALIGAVAVVLLAATFHRSARPRQVTALVGLTGAVGALLCGGTGVVMNLANGPAAATLLATNPYALPAFGGSAVMCALVVWSAVRTLRVARAR
jgi:hypothetical protein